MRPEVSLVRLFRIALHLSYLFPANPSENLKAVRSQHYIFKTHTGETCAHGVIVSW